MGTMKPLEFEKPLFDLTGKVEELRMLVKEKPQLEPELRALEEAARRERQKLYSSMTPWQCVQIARHANRPHGVDYIEHLFNETVELHGDRFYGDDLAVITGVGRRGSQRIAFIAQERGRDLNDRRLRNFGMSNPEGYRKAARAMELAAKFRFPLLCLVDTSGAYPGIGAEERGQFTAIALSVERMLRLPVPTVTFITGEGGSGGALAIAVSDRVYALRYSFYSVISPEGAAAIIWRDRKEAGRAAEALRITSDELLERGIVDGIIAEPVGGAHWEPEPVYRAVGEQLDSFIKEHSRLKPETLLKRRRERYLKFGEFTA